MKNTKLNKINRKPKENIPDEPKNKKRRTTRPKNGSKGKVGCNRTSRAKTKKQKQPVTKKQKIKQCLDNLQMVHKIQGALLGQMKSVIEH